MSLILFAIASGLLLIFAACVRQRRLEGVRISPDISKGVSPCSN